MNCKIHSQRANAFIGLRQMFGVFCGRQEFVQSSKSRAISISCALAPRRFDHKGRAQSSFDHCTVLHSTPTMQPRVLMLAPLKEMVMA